MANRDEVFDQVKEILVERLDIDEDDITLEAHLRDDLKAAYKAWMKALLTPRNPHTGVPLAKDPALAIVQVQNEDSLFFGTVAHSKISTMPTAGSCASVTPVYGLRVAWPERREL